MKENDHTKKSMANNEKTSKKIARNASKPLRDPETPKDVKRGAASALTQAPDKKKKSKK